MKIHYFFFAIIVAASFQILNAQNANDPVFISIGDHDISLSEFERIYKKNNANPNIEQQSVEEYLDLFINYKLKVIEAMNRGMDSSNAFQREFMTYRKQLVKPYTIDEEIMNDMIREIYERKKTELNVSHIILSPQENEALDSATAVDQLLHARERILKGADFGTVARELSDDPSVANNGGNLGYFTALRYVPEFEEVCYELEPGEVSMPFQTRFGYHIVQLNDKRPSRGQVKVAHIMLMTPQGLSQEAAQEIQEKIDMLYDSLQQGSSFTELAGRHSEDRSSAVKGGELDWFGSGRMVPEFEEAAFNLEQPGDISEPMQTSFGWHIIKLLDKKQLGSFENEKQSLKSLMNRLAYFRDLNNQSVEKLKEKFNFTFMPENLQVFYDEIDSSFYEQKWKMNDPESLDRVVMKLDGKVYTQKDFYHYLKGRQNIRHRSALDDIIDREKEQFIEQSLRALEMQRVEEENPELAHLLQEYHDGILLFELTDQMVWTRAIEDTTGLEKFFNEHKEDYQWGPRWESTVFYCPDEQKAQALKELLKPSKKDPSFYQDMIQTVCAADTGCITFRTEKYEKGDRSWLEPLWGKKGVYMVQPENEEKPGDLKVVVLHKKLKPAQKKLEDARGLVTADYQNFLEKKWIAELREKYEISINEDLLDRIE